MKEDRQQKKKRKVMQEGRKEEKKHDWEATKRERNVKLQKDRMGRKAKNKKKKVMRRI